MVLSADSGFNSSSRQHSPIGRMHVTERIGQLTTLTSLTLIGFDYLELSSSISCLQNLRCLKLHHSHLPAVDSFHGVKPVLQRFHWLQPLFPYGGRAYQPGLRAILIASRTLTTLCIHPAKTNADDVAKVTCCFQALCKCGASGMQFVSLANSSRLLPHKTDADDRGSVQCLSMPATLHGCSTNPT